MATIHGCILWWVGDGLAFGEKKKWGETYDEAMTLFGCECQTLRDACYVSRNVQLSRRRDKLSFSHHREVAKLLAGDPGPGSPGQEGQRPAGPPEADQRYSAATASDSHARFGFFSGKAPRDQVRARATSSSAQEKTPGPMPGGCVN